MCLHRSLKPLSTRGVPENWNRDKKKKKKHRWFQYFSSCIREIFITKWASYFLPAMRPWDGLYSHPCLVPVASLSNCKKKKNKVCSQSSSLLMTMYCITQLFYKICKNYSYQLNQTGTKYPLVWVCGHPLRPKQEAVIFKCFPLLHPSFSPP